MGLTDSFSRAVGYNAVDAAPVAAVAVKPQTSILKSLAPSIDFSVSAPPASQFRVDPAKNNAASLVGPNIQKVSGVQGELASAKATISETIRQAQREVSAAAKAEGHSAASLYPDNRIAAGGEAGLIAQVAVQAATGLAGLKGMGSLATFMNNASTVDTFVDDRRGMGQQDRAAAEAAIQQRLIASASPVVDTRQTLSFQEIVDGAADEGPGQSRLDWQGFFEQGHKLDELMAIDADNPAPGQVPEFDVINQASHFMDQTMASLQQASLTLQKQGLVNATGASTVSAGDVDLVVAGLEINGAKTDGATPPRSEAHLAVLATLGMEPDLEKLGLKPAAPQPTGGMAA